MSAPGRSQALVPLSFYLPCSVAEYERLPRALKDYVPWQASETALSPFLGRYHWVLQTFLQLRDAGMDARLVRTLPAEGVVFSHVECLDYGIRPTERTMFIPMLVDKDVPLPHGAIHVTHNPAQRLPLGLRQHYIPPWPQIGLLPRAAVRGERFETVAFIGYPGNLHPALAGEDFAARLATLGLRLVIPPPNAWHDFSDIDAILAVRTFGRDERHLNKPALKLYNAWAAGVPAVLGFETAYRSDGRPGVDYLEATNADEVFQCLQRLAAEPSLHTGVVRAGHEAMRARSEAQLRTLWLQFIEGSVLPLYRTWTRAPLQRAAFQIAGAVRERLLWRRPAWFGERA
jgi:hypothetical protein